MGECWSLRGYHFFNGTLQRTYTNSADARDTMTYSIRAENRSVFERKGTQAAVWCIGTRMHSYAGGLPAPRARETVAIRWRRGGLGDCRRVRKQCVCATTPFIALLRRARARPMSRGWSKCPHTGALQCIPPPQCEASPVRYMGIRTVQV